MGAKMSEPTRSAEALVQTVLDTPGVLEELKANPEETLKRLVPQSLAMTTRAMEGDKWVYRLVVLSLGLVVILSVAGSIFLAATKGDNAIPDIMTALGSAAVGALAGLLAPAPSQK
jgi:hypothetical protein